MPCMPLPKTVISSLLLISITIPCVFANSSEENILTEGYFVDANNDTSFATLSIPIYLEEPYYPTIQYGVEYKDKNGNTQRIRPKNTKSYGFVFKNRLIIMVSCKQFKLFLRLMDNTEFKLPNPDFKVFIRYTHPNPMIAILTKEPLTKLYFYQQGNSKLVHVNNTIGLHKLTNSMVDEENKKE